jgi:hypothetical protein
MSVVASSTYGGVDYDIRYADTDLGQAMDTDAVYPTDVGPTVLGEIWAPRLFAQGLDTLEIGGDGDVAVVAHDKRAFGVSTAAVAEEGGVAAHVQTGLVFETPAFQLGTEARGDVLTMSPLEGGGNATILGGGEMMFAATGAVELAGSTATIAAAGALDLTGASADIGATGDIVLTSDGNPTMTIRDGRVLIKGDLDVSGNIFTNSGPDDVTMEVAANLVELGDGRELEVTTGGEGSQQGLVINTVPDADGLAVASELDVYLRRFTDTSGQPVFYSADTFDTTKYAAANKILYKGLVFNVNGGSSVAGKKTLESRLHEPFWDMSGGAMKVSRTVPDATNDAVAKLSMAFRVTDAGELEVVRHKAPYTFTDGEYVEGESEDVQVLARWGHERSSSIKWVSSAFLRYALGESVSRVLAAVANTETTTSEIIDGPQGLQLDGTTLTGTLSTLATSVFRVRITPEGEPMIERTFTQDSGVTGMGGQFGIPEGVVFEPALTHDINVPRLMFEEGSALWHSIANDKPAGYQPTFTVTYPSPTQVTHIRFWSQLHDASQRITGCNVFGDESLIAEYGPESRPILSLGTDYAAWSTAWTELNEGMTLAIASPAAYSRYTFVFISATYVSLGKMQLLNVPDGAAVPDALFLEAPTWEKRVGPMYPSLSRPFSYQLAAGTPNAPAGVSTVTYLLAPGSTLPPGLTLSADGVISGTATTLGEAYDEPTSGSVVRALIGGPAPSYVPFTTEPAVFSFLSSELHDTYTNGGTVAAWGEGFVQAEEANKPSYEASTLSANFTGTDNLCLFNPTIEFVAGGGLSLVARMVIDSYSDDTHIFSLNHADTGVRIVFKLFDNKVRARIAGQELDIAEAVVGKWFALAFAYDAATGAFESYVDGVSYATGTFPVYGSTPVFDAAFLGANYGNTIGMRISHAVCYARKLTFDNMVLAQVGGPTPSYASKNLTIPFVASNALRTLASEELYGRYVTGERVAAWGNGAFAQADAAFRPTYDESTRSLHFTGLGAGLGASNLVLTNPDPRIVESGGFSVVVRVQVNSGDQSARIFELVPQTTGNTLGLKIGNGQIRAMVQSNEEIITSYVPGRWVTVAYTYNAVTGAYGLYADGVLTGSGTHPIFTTEPVYAAATLGPTDGTQVDMRVKHTAFYSRVLSEADVLVSHLHMTTTLLSRKSMLPSLGLQTDNRVLEWGMFTGDRATAPAYNASPYLSFASGQSMRVIEEADRLFVFGDQGGLSVVLRVRINSLGTDERILECGVEADGDRHMYIAREGGTDALTLHMAGASGSLGALTLGEWVTLAFTYNAGDGQTRTFNAGELVEMFTAVPTGDIAFGTIELAARTGTMDVEHVAMWPHKLSDTHAGTYSWEGVHNVRKSTPKSFATLDASQLTALAQDAPVVEWGTSADGQALYDQTNTDKQPAYNAEGYVMFRGDFLSSPTVKLEGSRYGGLTAIAHLRWLQDTGASYPRLFDFGDLMSSVLSVGLYQNTTTSYFKPGNIQSVAFTYGEWTTIVVVHEYTDDGRATNTWYKDGVLIKSVTDAARILTDTYAFGRIGTSVYDGTDTAAHMDLKYISFYHGALSKEAIDSVVETIGVPPEEYAYADKSIGGDTALPVGWSITSGGHHLAASPLNMFIPLADRAGMNQFYMSFETVPYFDINAGAPIRLTKLEMWAFTWKLAQHHLNIEGIKVFATNDSTWGTSVLIHEAGKTKAQPPTLPYTSEPNTPENQIIVADAFKANWADTMDHATTDITPTPVLYRYFRIQFQCAVGLTLGAMRVSYDDSPDQPPVLPSDRSPVVLMNASSVKATNSLTNLVDDTNNPKDASGVTVRRHIPTDGLGATKEFEYMSGDITAGFRLDADVMPDTEYTFVHLTKYRDPATHLRIWQSDANFISGFHGNGASIYHEVYIVEGTVSDANAWRLTIDQRAFGRINGGELEGRNEEGQTAREIIVNPVSHQYLTHEHSPWDIAEVLLYEGNLDTVDISALEAYFAEKYGLTFPTV